MENYHKIQLENIRLLDSKSYSTLGAVGIIASFYFGFGTLVLDKYHTNSLIFLWIITFIIGIFLLILSAWCCLRVIQVKFISFGPKPEDLSKYLNKSNKELINDLITSYKNILIRNNLNINEEKAFWVKYAIEGLTYAIFTVLFTTVITIMMAMNWELWPSTLTLIIIILSLLIMLCFITKIEDKYIKKFARSL